jgi:aspartyl aminopeptidase
MSENHSKTFKFAWDKYEEKDMERLNSLSSEYKTFLSKCKTERECVKELIAEAEKNGFKSLKSAIEKGDKLKPGDKVYSNNMDKNLILYTLGKEPMVKGLTILGAHIDSPRMDLKQTPLYEDILYTTHLSYLKTHYYGGIKKYQWVTIPLAIHGVVILKDGKEVNINIGEDEEDPVFCVTDLLVHLSADQMDKKGNKLIEGEDLNILFGSIPIKDEKEKYRVKMNVLNLLYEKYGIEEEDFTSSELELVPSGKARDCGFDRSMILGYGHDDRVCAYTSFAAHLNIENPEKTCVCLLVDKEEIGSVGATGMSSMYFENSLAEIMNLCGDYSELKLRRTLQNSKMLSSDVSAAYDSNFYTVMDIRNSAFLGKGVVFNKYTGVRGKVSCNDANPEFIAEIRAIMEKHNVSWQTGELGKVDQGGGGTIAYIMAKYGMNVIDCGVPVLSMHSPSEIVSKADVYETYRAYLAFLKEA